MKGISVYLVVLLAVAVGMGAADQLCEKIVKHPEMDGDLGITVEQREKMENLFERTEKEIIESTGRVRIKQLEMERAMRSEEPDMREIRKLVNEIGDARSALMLAGIERNLKVREILGPDQVDRARKMMRIGGKGRAAGRGMRGFERLGRGMMGRGMEDMRMPRCCHGMMHGGGCCCMKGMGCHGSMMQRHGGSGMHGKGCHGDMMKGSEGSGMHGKGCHGDMMKKSDAPPENKGGSGGN